MTNRISQAVRQSLDIAEVFQTAVTELGAHLEVDRCSLFMKNDRSGRVTNVAEYHVPEVLPAGHDFQVGKLGYLISGLEKESAIFFDDAAHDPAIADLYQQVLSKADVRSIMYVAIKAGDETPAAFALSTTRQARHWSESDIAVAKAVADQTGIAIRQAKLYQKAEATSTREALANRLSLAIRASLSLPEVLSSATRELGRALSASRVHLRLYDATNASSPLQHEYLAPGCSSINQTDEVRYWSEDEVALVGSVAAQLAIGIAQAELFEMVERAKKEWESTFDAMSDGIFMFDRNGQLNRVNRAGADFEQLSPQLLSGRHCCDILRTSADDEFCIVEKALVESRSVTLEITPKRLNRPLLVTVEP